MKKKLALLIILNTLFFTSNAQALMLDPAIWISKISGWVQKQADAVLKIQQQVSKIKQITSQGSTKEFLLGKALNYASKASGEYFTGLTEALIENSKGKSQETMTAEMDTYVEGQGEYSDAKIAIIEANLEEAKSNLIDKKVDLIAANTKVDLLYEAYLEVKGTVGVEDAALTAYLVAVAQRDEIILDISELEYLVDELEEQLQSYEDEKAEIGTEDDVKYMKFMERLDQLENIAANDELYQVEIDIEQYEWDSEDVVSSISPTNEDFTDFIEFYFLDPNSIDQEDGGKRRIAYQTRTDRATRERRFLATNTAIHLMQVSATARREIPQRISAADEMFNSTTDSDGELEAIGSYSATKVQNMRALLLYAKLLSVKLQYSAANELLITDIEKEMDSDRDYTKFNLGYYKLTLDDVEELGEKANTAIDTESIFEE